MAKGYHHLTQDERSRLAALVAAKISMRKIADLLNMHHSTLSRELADNKDGQGHYDPIAAHKKAQQRKSRSCHGKPRKIAGALQERIIVHLKEHWSPEQIAGRLKLEGIFISHESIYQFVWADKKAGGTLCSYLRHSGKKYQKRSGKTAGRGLIPRRVDISQRPKIVEEKARLGDWEGDTIIGAAHQGALLTLVDRHSKLVKIAHLPEKTAELVLHQACALLRSLDTPVLSITFDNGKEFAAHEKISEELATSCFFARPYHSWERGLNEHTNGLIRQYLPKKTSLKEVSLEQIKFIEDILNNRPRKILNYKTPNEVFFALRAQSPVAVAA